MKITSTEEYGLRILVQIGRSEYGELTIAQIAEKENLTHANVAKICRLLRMGDVLDSSKGHTGGYHLARPASNILLSEVMDALGEPLYSGEFCDKFTGQDQICTHNLECSIRSVWKMIQSNVDSVLNSIKLSDLIKIEQSKDTDC